MEQLSARDLDTRVRVAFAFGTAAVPAWQRDALEIVRALPGVRTVVIVVPRAGRRTMPLRMSASVICKPQPLTGPFAGSSELRDADIIVDFTGRSIDARPRLGIWRYRLGLDDHWAYPFAREFASGASTVTVTLERREGEATSALRVGRLPASSWYSSTVYKSLSEASRWIGELVSAARDGVALPVLVAPARGPGIAELGGIRMPIVLASFARRLIEGIVEESVTDFVWNVGIVRGDAARLLRDEPFVVDWFDEPAAGTWVADPFPIERDGVRAIVAEEYEERTHKGRIVALLLDESGNIGSRSVIIDLPTHLSYPFPLEIEGRPYLIPENSETNAAFAYRCIRFPDVWHIDRAIVDGLDVVDPTIERIGDLWWLFHTLRSRGRDTSLHAMYSNSPYGPWTAHPLNPIVSDVSCARPAGRLFRVDDALYRPGQDCSKTYGGAIAIARIDEISRTAYRETVVRRIEPAAGRYPDGIHTVNLIGSSIVVDGKREIRSARFVRDRAVAVVRRGVGALRRRR